jgi:photosystem II stability/assembly factor-like uncharacterized protein
VLPEGGAAAIVRELGCVAVCGGQPGAGSQWRAYYRTDDGGNSWRQTERGIASGYISGLDYASEQVGFESAHRLGIARLPGHKTLLLTEPADDVLSMSWPDAEHGFAVLGHAGLVRSGNGGQSWRRIYPRALPPPAGLVSFSSAKRGIGVGLALGVFSRAGAILATTDSGTSWRVRGSLEGATPRGVEVDGLARISPDRLWAVGHEFVRDTFRVLLFRSADDGRHWRQVRSFPFLSDGWLSFPTARDGYTGDGDGNLYHTRDGGRT